jgi:hypothetical protein
MNCAVEMGSGFLIYVQSFIQIGSAIQKLMRGNSHTDRQKSDLISLLFFLNKESRLKMANSWRTNL